MKFKEIFGDMFWNEWIEERHITEEQLEKLKTKHTKYEIKPSYSIKDTHIEVKYLVTFFQNGRKVDSVELQVYDVEVKYDDLLLRRLMDNYQILNNLVDKIDKYRNDGRSMKRPTVEEVFGMYVKPVEKIRERLAKGES